MAEGGTGTTVTDQEWYGALDDETKGYMLARGLDKKPVNEAFLATIAAHRNAESKIGGPADEMFRWKKDDPEATKAALKRLGVPDDATAYDFKDVKLPDGSPVKDEFANFFRSAAQKANMTVEAAKNFAQEFIGFNEKAAADAKSADRIKVAAAHDQLKANWGANFDSNMFVANRALDLLGVPREVLNVLSEQSSFGTVMEGLLKMGKSMGESKLLGLGGDAPGANKVMSAEEAANQKRELMGDASFVARWGKGDVEALKQIEGLDRIIVGARQRGWQPT